ncbi:hypothetical protein EXIGLDRAFT_829868 [Exidia glandulosa HHB12029]|uniref:Uncharacterized protein n=1 Tax=Exidia glandulosa HHB12029 TaxID=1314781 RepID=A0A166BJH1_EXIGL|nr:hypothetical protein EXIGLDRAFT_829868 [Exidia glandulosa HHB12029]
MILSVVRPPANPDKGPSRGTIEIGNFLPQRPSPGTIVPGGFGAEVRSGVTITTYLETLVMAQSARNALQRRLQLDERLLAAVEENTTQLERARAEALSAVAAAQAILDAVLGDLAHSQARRAELRKAVEGIRLSIRRQQVDALPLELLREIFLLLASEPDDLWKRVGEGSSNIARSRLPFDLAAVCTRWRALALETSELWRYIGVPAPSLQSPRRASYYLHWVQTLLHRSKGSTLDIILNWQNDAPCQNDSCSSRILEAIALHSHRWRRFELHIPEHYLSVQTASIFRRPTPSLEWFALPSPTADQDLRWTPSYPRYLPLCPLLQRLRSDHNLIPGYGAEPTQSFTHLVSLELCFLVPCKVIWALLSNTTSLESLELQFNTDDAPQFPADVHDPPSKAFSLPCLRKLSVYGEGTSTMFAAAVGLISMPALVTLSLDSGMRLLESFLEGVKSTVKQLRVYNHVLDLDALPSLRTLINAEDLRLYNCTLHDDLSRSFAATDDWLLPRLESLRLESIDISPADGDGLARLVQSRIEPRPDAAGQVAWKLDNVSFVKCPLIPSWLIAEVNCLLGRNLDVEDTTEDPVV